MARVRDPILFSRHFDVDPGTLKEMGVFDPILNVDSLLFVDPLMLKYSEHSEMCNGAVREFNQYFERVFALLRGSRHQNDVAWRSARKYLTFPEIRGTCLGYGAASTKGSAWGPQTTEHVLRTAKEAVDLGVVDPTLFPALALIEDKMGPDLISDMTVKVILPSLLAFNTRIISELAIKAIPFRIGGAVHELIPNPTESNKAPVILVPRDVLRALPVATDRSDIARVCSENDSLRSAVSQHIGEIWMAKTLKDKAKIRGDAMASKEALETLLAILTDAKGTAYDIEKDPEGIVSWLTSALEAVEANPVQIKRPTTKDASGLSEVVSAILGQFTVLVQDKGLWKEFWNDEGHRNEKSAQRLFFAVADSYCKANNLDISPEADSGSGPVDFKFSTGYKTRFLTEVKLSTNGKLVDGYLKQLAAYERAESTNKSAYLVVWLYDRDKARVDRLYQAQKAAATKGKPVPEIWLVDGRRRPSASKL